MRRRFKCSTKVRCELKIEVYDFLGVLFPSRTSPRLGKAGRLPVSATGSASDDVMGPVISYKVDQATLPTTAIRHRSIPSCVTSLSKCPTLNTLSVSKLRCRSATGAGRVARLSQRALHSTRSATASSRTREIAMQKYVHLLLVLLL